VRLSSRRSDADADVIRARLRALLEERPVRGWVPGADDEELDVGAGWPVRGRTTPTLTDGRAHAGDRDPGTGSAPIDDDPGAATLPPDDDALGTATLPPGVGRHRAPGSAARWDPGRGGARSLWIAALTAALLLAGWTWLDRPRVEPAPPASVASSPAATSTPAPAVGEAADASEAVVVSVVGLVARPGLVTLPPGARVADAVEAAGGFLPEADPASVNLAALLTDGAQVAVGVPGGVAGVGADAEGGSSSGLPGRVDLNAASAAELDALPGIGPVLAQRIVEHRTRNGPFESVAQLDDVPGIGPAIAAELAELVGL
jgi:competence protein ComEA